jgi:hypothetical protein
MPSAFLVMIDHAVILLLLPSSILLFGAGLLAVVPVDKLPVLHQRRPWVVAALLGATLILLAVNPNRSSGEWQLTPGTLLGSLTPSLAIRANGAGRWLGLALVLTSLSAVLGGIGRKSIPDSAGQSGDAADWSILLVLAAVCLLCLLPSNLYTLALIWTALDGVTGAAWLLTTRRQQGPLIHWGAGAAGTLALWSAALSMQAGLTSQSLPIPTVEPGWTGTALVLAGTLRLAPFPFHLGRPHLATDLFRNPALKPARQILPLSSGAWLLAQVPGTDFVPFFPQQFITTLLLTGLVGSGLLAWLPGEEIRAVRWVVRGQAAMTVLACIWAGPEAALAQGMVLVLAGGLILVSADSQETPPEQKVLAGMAIAALAGIPLTWGGIGRFALYQRWLASPWGLYLFLAAGAWLLLLGAAGRPLFRTSSPGVARQTRIVAGLTNALLVVGLLAAPGAAASAWAWLAIILPLAAGGILAKEARSLQPLQQQLENRLHPVLALHWLRRAAGRLAAAIGRAANAVHQTLEGEGAVLWLLVLLALAWLLLGSTSPG